MLSTAVSSSITCGSSSVPAFQEALSTVKAEYGTKRYSFSKMFTSFVHLETFSCARLALYFPSFAVSVVKKKELNVYLKSYY